MKSYVLVKKKKTNCLKPKQSIFSEPHTNYSRTLASFYTCAKVEYISQRLLCFYCNATMVSGEPVNVSLKMLWQLEFTDKTRLALSN